MTSEPETPAKCEVDLWKTLRASAWDDFHTRRTYEWKIALSLWTAMAAFAGTTLAGHVTVDRCTLLRAVIAAAVALTALHTLFAWGVCRANDLNRKRQFFFEDQMMKRLDLHYPEEIDLLIKQARERSGSLLNWSHLFQLGITVLLAFGDVFVSIVATQ